MGDPAQVTKTITRREALKALTALSGALLAGAALPDKWTKPVVGSGVLPAHAQASLIYTFLRCEVIMVDSDLPFVTRAWITPVASGISLTCDWEFTPDTGDPKSGSFTETTDPSGMVEPYIEEITWGDLDVNTATLKVTWSFTNPLNGSDTCEDEYSIMPE